MRRAKRRLIGGRHGEAVAASGHARMAAAVVIGCLVSTTAITTVLPAHADTPVLPTRSAADAVHFSGDVSVSVDSSEAIEVGRGPTLGEAVSGAGKASYGDGVDGTTPAVSVDVPARGCPPAGVCEDIGTLTFTFSQPVRDPRLHVAGLGELTETEDGVSSSAARLRLTTPGIGVDVVSGDNLHAGQDEITVRRAPSDRGCGVTAHIAAGCGTVELQGTVSEVSFDIESHAVVVSGEPAKSSADRFAVTFSYRIENLVTEDRTRGPPEEDAEPKVPSSGPSTPEPSDASKSPATPGRLPSALSSPSRGESSTSPQSSEPTPTSRSPSATTGAARLVGSNFNCTGNPVYGLRSEASGGTRQIYAINTSTGQLTVDGTLNASSSGTGANVNGIGILPGGAAMYATDGANVYRYDSVPGTTTRYAGVSGAATTHGAINQATSANGFYYFGGISGTAAPYTVSIYGFNTQTNTSIGLVARGTVPVDGTSGDWAFDGQGRLYLTGGGNSGNNNAVVVLNQLLPTTAQGTPIAVTGTRIATVTATGSVFGVAFGTGGYLYLESGSGTSSTQLQQVNPSTGAVVATRSLTPSDNGNRDMASCTVPDTLVLRKNFTGRFAATDQVQLSITGGGLTTGNTGTTTGSATGLQPVTAGPVLGLEGTTYTITETATSGSLANYLVSYRCTNPETGAVITTGSSTTGSFVQPDGGADCTFTNSPIAPAIDLVKTAGTPTGTTAGSTITYSFSVTNTGNIPLDSVTVSDPKVGTVTCPPGALAPGGSRTCSAAPYAITQADINAGVVNNTATATGTATGRPAVTDPASTSTTLPRNPSLTIDKVASAPTDVNGNGLTDAGDRITYTFTVQNTGNVTLNPVTVSDTKVGTVTCPAGALAPGANRACTAATYTITAADQTAGTANNTATASGTPPSGSAVTATDTTSTPVTAPAPGIRLVKQAGTPSGNTAGSTIAYTFTVTNTGNVSLSAVGVTDAKVGPVACPAPATLAVAASKICTATYTVTQADVNAGSVVNNATASGTPQGTTTPITSGATATTPITQVRTLALDKTAGTPVDVNSSGITDAGDTVAYTFVVTNTGNVTVTGVAINDPEFAGATCTPTTLPPNQTATCSRATPYVITTADQTAGAAENTARGTGTAAGTAIQSTPDTTTVSVIAPTPQLTFDKVAGTPVDVNSSGITDAGDTIQYTFVITNTGNVPLRNLAVVDPEAGTVTCPVTTLAPGAATTCAAASPYVVTVGDEQSGQAVNTARATGINPNGGTVNSANDSTTVEVVEPQPRLSLRKIADPPVDVNSSGIADAGDTIRYSFVITNTGNVPIRNPAVDDNLTGPVTCAPPPVLQPGNTTDCVADNLYVITGANETAEAVTNTATARGLEPDGPTVRSNSDSTITKLTKQAAVISMEKIAAPPVDVNNSGLTDAGDTIQYTFSVRNLGNVPVTQLAVVDPQLPSVTCQTRTLAPGTTTSCTAGSPYRITADDEAAGEHVNTAQANARDPDNDVVESPEDSTVTPVTAPEPLLTLTKTAGTPVDVDGNGLNDAGDRVTYTFTVTNPGNVPLRNVTVSDPKVGPVTCTPAGPLAPGASRNCTAPPYTITATDEASGSAINIARASGLDPSGGTVNTARDASTATPLTAPNPILALTKTAGAPVDVNGSGITDAGDRISYSFTVANAGNVPVTGLVVNDLKVGTVTCLATALAVGASTTCTAGPYTVRAADEAAGAVNNSATATADVVGNGTVSSPAATTSTPVTAPNPALTLDKAAAAPVDANGSGLPDAGDEISYSFVVRNTGNVPLTGITLADSLVTGETCAPTALAPGGTAACTAGVYVVTAADEGSGGATNTATASATDPDGGAVSSAPDSTTTALTRPNPVLQLDKTAAAPVDANGSGITDVGDTVAYTFTVTNRGNVPVNAVAVLDPRVGPVVCAATSLAVGASTTCAGTAAVTEADEAAGSLVNTATATGTGVTGGSTTSNPDSTTTPVTTPRPALGIDKAAGTPVDENDSGITDEGDTIAYTFTVTNLGNVPLSGVIVADDTVGPVTCTPTTIDPGEAAGCAADTLYEVTAVDEAAGSVDNRATAGGTDADGGTVTSPADSTSTQVTAPLALLQLDKAAGTPDDANSSGVTDAGDTIPYSFLVVNEGNVPALLLGINDPLAGTVTCPDVTLGPGESTTCIADDPYEITEADEDAGRVENVATATAVDPDGNLVESNTDRTITPVIRPNPVLTLDKTAGAPVDANGSGIPDAGDTIAYSFTVTNDGNVPISGVTVTDDLAGAVTCPTTILAPAASTTCTANAPYAITAADQTEGVVINTAGASGVDPDGGGVSATPDSTSTLITRPNPVLQLDKTAAAPVDVNSSGITDAGDTVAFTFTVTNSGNVPISGVSIVDPRAADPITCAATSLAVGASTTCTGTATVTATDEAAGSLVNTATARGTGATGGTTTSNADSTTTPVTAPNPSVSLDKTAAAPTDVNGSGIPDAGDTIAYTFAVANSGNVPLTGITVSDPLAGPVTCTPTTLAPGAVASCVAEDPYVITGVDETAGSVANQATARGTDPDGDTATSLADQTSTPVTTPAPALEFVKSAAAPIDVNGSGITDAGDTVAYSFLVTNRGNVPVSGLVINDPPAGAVSCPVTTLAPGASTTCAAAALYVITEANELAGRVENVATARAVDPDGDPVASNSSRTATVVSRPTPVLTLDKTAGTPVDVNGSAINDAGDTIAYTFTVTNDGNVPIGGVEVADPLVGAVTCTPTTLAPGTTASCAADDPYVITAADETAEEVRNNATATGVDPDGDAVVSGPDSTVTPVTEGAAALELDKNAAAPADVNGSGITDAGDTIAFTFVVTNTGNVPITGLAIDDDLAGAVTCPATTLAPGAVTTCTAAPYVVTADDETAGRVLNTASATGSDPDADVVTSNTDSTTTPATEPNPSLSLDKIAAAPADVNGSGITDAGDTIAYTFTVTNDGNVPISDIEIADSELAIIACDPSALAPGESVTCVATTPYAITEDDEAAGAADNTAIAVGIDPDGELARSNDDTTVVPVTAPNPSLELDKIADAPVDVNNSGLTDAGDTIAYRFVVVNTGNVPVTGVAIADSNLPAVACTPNALAPGASVTCVSATPYVITEAHEALGVVDNTATASGTEPDGATVTSNTDSTVVPVTTPRPSLTLDKSAASPVDVNNSGITDAGDTIAYTFTVTNDGNVPISGAAVTDQLVGPVTCTSTTLSLGATATCTAELYPITAADEEARQVSNTATARGVDPDGGAVTSAPDSTVTAVTPGAPGLLLNKAAAAPVDVNGSGITDAGDTIVFTFLVTNTGNVPVSGIAITDGLVGPVTCAATTLTPAATATCTADDPYEITEADETTGRVVNTATATGTDPDGKPVLSNADSTSTSVTASTPSLNLDKIALAPVDNNGSGITDAGDAVSYEFVVTNTGNVPVTEVAIVDSILPAVTCDPTTLLPADSVTCTSTSPYVVTEADEEAGTVGNTATATGTDPDGAGVASEADSTVVRVTPPNPSLLVDKIAEPPTDVNNSGIADADDTIAFSFLVTNNGNVPISGVEIADSEVQDVACDPSVLAPGESVSCVATTPYRITEADEAAGAADNTAVAVGFDPDGGFTFSAGDTTSTPVTEPRPVLSLDKFVLTVADIDQSGITDAGDLIEWVFVVTNDGNVPVSGASVTDPLVGDIFCETDDDGNPIVLQPGQETRCRMPFFYVITEDDEAAGQVVNTATGTGIDPDGGTVTSNSDSTVTPITAPNPALSLDKTAAAPVDVNGSGLTDAGDTIAFTFTVTNTGNVPITELEVLDPKVGTLTCAGAELLPGESTACESATLYRVTEADEAAGAVVNTATATGLEPEGTRISDTDSTSTPVTAPNPRLSLEKIAGTPVDVNSSGLVDAGDTITYAFTVTNTGNVPIRGVNVADPKVGAVFCADDELDPAEATSCVADPTYVVTEADEAAGQVTNVATARGIDPDEQPVTSPTATTTTGVSTPIVALTLDKQAATPTDVNASGITDAGDTIAYTFVLRNAGNVPISSLEIDDPLAGEVSCPVTSLAPGASTTCTAPLHVVTLAEVDAGTVTNTATASGLDPDEGVVESGLDTTTTPTTKPNPVLELDKSAAAPVDANGSGLTDEGDTIAYSFLIRNEGNVPLAAIRVVDSIAGPVTCLATALAPGASTTCTANRPYLVTEEDEIRGSVENTAYATGTDPDGGDESSNLDSTTTAAVPLRTGSLLDKDASLADADGDDLADVGEVITYSFTVTNTGNVALTDLTVSDPRAGAVTCSATELVAGASTTCSAAAPYVVRQSDVDAEGVLNTATVSGQPPTGDPVTATDTVSTATDTRTDLTLDKQATLSDLDVDGLADPGEQITYTFRVTNTGTTTVVDLTIRDDRLTAAGDTVRCPTTTLAPAAQTVCTAAYDVTVADVERGPLTNVATAEGVGCSRPAVVGAALRAAVLVAACGAVRSAPDRVTVGIDPPGEPPPPTPTPPAPTPTPTPPPTPPAPTPPAPTPAAPTPPSPGSDDPHPPDPHPYDPTPGTDNLPDTGGPPLLALLIGLALTLSGMGVLLGTRRRGRTSPSRSARSARMGR